MPKVADDELPVLRDLWDRTIRTEEQISDRIGVGRKQVAKCLESLEAKYLVQRRLDKGPESWRITPEGEAFFIHSYQKPWYEKPHGLLLIGLIVAILGGVISGVIVAVYQALSQTNM